MKDLSLHREQVAVPLPPQREARSCDTFIANDECVVKIRVSFKSILPWLPLRKQAYRDLVFVAASGKMGRTIAVARLLPPQREARLCDAFIANDECVVKILVAVKSLLPWLPLWRELARSD